MPEIPKELQCDVRDYLERQVRTGFVDLDELPQIAVDYFTDGTEAPDLEIFARAALQDILIDYRAEQRDWPPITDCDRLDAAFQELEERGIVARQNFWCCGTCGIAGIWEEIENTQKQGAAVRGYTFYHEQYTERAVESGGVYLYYGSVKGGETPALDIAREIQDVLDRRGLTTDWDGTFKTRVLVKLDWKRRVA